MSDVGDSRRSSQSRFTFLPVGALLSMPFQSRTSVDDPELAELVESIKAYGVLEPIVVRQKPNGLIETVVGERRVKAAIKAGLVEVPVIVRVLSDQEAYEIQLTENIQRRDLSAMEKARMLDYMIKTFGYTQRALGEKLAKSESWVSQHLKMLELEKLCPGKVQTSGLTERQAREILAAPSEKREEILDRINETGQIPSAREIEKAVKTVPCARCGEPISEPVHLNGKFYHEDCAEQVKAESCEEEPTETRETDEASRRPAKSAEPVDFAEVNCPVCKETFRLVHHGHHDHRAIYFKEESE